MDLAAIRDALKTLTQLVEGAAETVMDVTMQSKANDADYEFIGFASRRNVLLTQQPSDEEEAFKLLDSMHAALAKRMAGKSVMVAWKLRPEIILSIDGMRVGCRVKITPALAKPKLVVAS